jgi:NAD(P)-dependent dehydrogenase (short-subunit alcohol dehydrogenase family)
MRGLRDKVALVVGGAGGIGTATCIRLSEEGAAVVVADLNTTEARRVAEEITGRRGIAVATTVDISDDDSVAAAVALAVSEFGGLELLHANAADLSPENIGRDSNVVDVPLEVVRRTFAVTAGGYLSCARHALPELQKRGGGAMVFTSSATAFAGEPERPAYAMAKSSIGGLVRHIASRWGTEGIRANAVAPGLVLTEATEQSIDEGFRSYALQLGRSNRLGRPGDIAAMVAFLLSSDGEWINGQVISVDGGATMR